MRYGLRESQSRPSFANDGLKMLMTKKGSDSKYGVLLLVAETLREMLWRTDSKLETAGDTKLFKEMIAM
jgi:hypothetical protein